MMSTLFSPHATRSRNEASTTIGSVVSRPCLAEWPPWRHRGAAHPALVDDDLSFQVLDIRMGLLSSNHEFLRVTNSIAFTNAPPGLEFISNTMRQIIHAASGPQTPASNGEVTI